MKKGFRWLRFGGWFGWRSREAVAESWRRRFGWFGRFDIHLGRILLDAVKAVAILLVLFRVTLPLRPLAVPPPPADLVARYVPPEQEAMDDGTAWRMLLGLMPPADLKLSGMTNAIVVEGWQERWGQFREASGGLEGRLATSRWDRVATPSTDAALDGLLPPILAFADACASESPGHAFIDNDNPFISFLSSWQPVLTLLRLEAFRQVDRGNPEAAKTAIRRLLDSSGYASRGQMIVDGLVSGLFQRLALRATLRLTEAAPGLDRADAQAMDAVWVDAAAKTLPITVSFRGELLGRAAKEKRAFFYRKDIRLKALKMGLGLEPVTSTNGGWLVGYNEQEGRPPRRRFIPGAFGYLVLFSGWSGNDQSGHARVAENRALWTLVEMGAALDPKGPPLEDLDIWDKVETDSWTSYLKRGWIAYVFQPIFKPFASKVHRMKSHQATARTALKLSAFRREVGREAETLAEVEERFGWTAPKQPLTEHPIEYLRLALPEDAAPGTSGYALACWADGRAVRKGGGSVALVVRNPAFGELPFRVFQWSSDGSRFAVETNSVVVGNVQRPGYNGERQPVLNVAPGLFSADPVVWEQAEEAMKKAGWEL